MIANHEQPRWSFYLLWILLTMFCVPIAFFLSLIILRIIVLFVGDFINVNGVQHITEDYLALYVFVPLMGLLTGVLQYELLRRYFPRMRSWVAATIGGWLLGAFLILTHGWLNPTNTVLSLDLAFLIMGLSIGVGQWLLLRQRLPRAGWWIGANVVGWSILALVTNGNSMGQFGLFALGLLPACATALMLALLIKQVQPTGSQGA